MQVIRDNPGRQLLKSSVVTIGNFDGLHLGHQSLIRRCKSLAGGKRPVAMVTFEPLPQAWFNPDTAPARLLSVYQKLEFLGNEGLDLVWLMRFDAALAGLGARDFVQQVLVREHGEALAEKGPFSSDMEYMKLSELKYTLKR